VPGSKNVDITQVVDGVSEGDLRKVVGACGSEAKFFGYINNGIPYNP